MKLTLMIEGDASVIAMVLASLPNGASLSPAPVMPTAPVPMPVAAGNADDDDENGEPAANAPDVDSTGLPWDERIHAKTKAMAGPDGAKTWRKRRGVDDATVTAVEAELRARTAAPVPMPAMQPAPAPMPVTAPVPMPAPMPMGDNAPAPMPVAAAPIPAPVAVPPMPMGDNAPAPMPVAAAPVPMPAPAPAPEPVQAAVAVASGPLDFSQFMLHLANQSAKRDANGAPLIHADYLAALTAEIAGAFNVQLSAITDIAPNANMINFAQQAMQRDGKW